MEFVLKIITSSIDMMAIIMITCCLAQSTRETKRSVFVILLWMAFAYIFSIVFMWR